jgi:hypothetical protein
MVHPPCCPDATRKFIFLEKRKKLFFVFTKKNICTGSSRKPFVFKAEKSRLLRYATCPCFGKNDQIHQGTLPPLKRLARPLKIEFDSFLELGEQKFYFSLTQLLLNGYNFFSLEGRKNESAIKQVHRIDPMCILTINVVGKFFMGNETKKTCSGFR